ncbi:hypothetical protein [Pectinatus frisingensis]|uniref:hypothetical protein n=1 Tax=Pectinatus frisingensis TaxID=865 RepID=UPI0018C7F39B|nr:hypothetical protein [Pectinatus frisingensis]
MKYAVAVAYDGKNEIKIVETKSPFDAMIKVMGLEEEKENYSDIDEIQEMAWDGGTAVSKPLKLNREILK